MKKVFGILAISTILSGCGYATKSDINALKANLEKTAVVANNANVTANNAMKAANNAVEEVTRVKEITSVCCAENRARLDALFDKAMYK